MEVPVSAQLMAVGIALAGWLAGFPRLSYSFWEAVSLCCPTEGQESILPSAWGEAYINYL